MSILKFPRYVFDEDTEYHELRQLKAPDGASPCVIFTVDVTKRLHKGNSRVYRANLISAEGVPLDVVCKLGYGKRFIDQTLAEADFYLNELQRIQGVYVPRFRGLYAGETDDGYTLCLVLDYCGEPLYTELWSLTSDEKVAIVSALLAVHGMGVKHCDFNESNVVLNERGQAFVINFGKSQKHKCKLGVKVVLNAKEPLEEEVQCSEIFEVCSMGEVWGPRVVQFFRWMVPVEWAESEETLVSHAPTTMDSAYARIQAAITIRLLEEWWDQRDERDAAR